VVRVVLQQLEPARDNIVLIGGQALNLWAERYSDRAADLAAAAPFTSKDIDFCGTAQDVNNVRCLSAARISSLAQMSEPQPRAS
jgi:hypothetical protein